MRNGAADRFENVLDLQTAHLALMQRQQDRRSAGGGLLPQEEITDFLARVARTGAVLSTPADRRIAQRVLDYWTADLLDTARGYSGPVATETLLACEAEDSDARPAGLAEGHGSREYIRLAAQARQWRDTRSHGYLLSGKALRSAERFSRDPEIADLIAASLAEEQREARRARRRKRIAAGLTLALVAAVAMAGIFFLKVETATHEAAEAAGEKGALARDVVFLGDEERLRAQERQVALENANIERRIAQEHMDALSERQSRLDAAQGALADLVTAERLPLAGLPDGVAEDVLRILALRQAEGRLDPSVLAPDVAAALAPVAADMEGSVFALDLKGYDPLFLGRSLPLPALDRAAQAAAFRGGEAVPYVHFSFLYNQARRAPLVAAVNFDRAARQVLPATGTPIEPDPRLPPELRPDPSRFEGGLVAADYVDRTMISWGEPLAADPFRTARMLDQSVQLHLNKAPVHPAAAAVWTGLTHWIREQHNRSATRVTFFTGPIFQPGESAVPASLWLIAVSLRDPVWVPAGQEQPFVAEAFLIPNRPDTLMEEPWKLAMTIEGIGRATGLRFLDEIVRADRGRTIVNATEGDRLADRAGALNNPPSEDQTALMAELALALQGGRLPASEQAKIIRELAGLLAGPPDLTSAGRVNVLTLLAGVPAESWNRPDWIVLKAEVRRAVVRVREPAPEPEAQGLVDRLAGALGLDEPPPQRVFIQFADMTRESVRSLAERIAALGWTVPPEERVADASGLNEVRFNPDSAEDAAAARLLAADLAAAGRPGVRAVPLSVIRPQVLEVWIGGPTR